MKVIGIIPARYQSTRLPHKPLVSILGKPLILHVYEQVSQAKILDKVIVATDHRKIAEVIKKAGGDVVMTGHCASGTDRVAEAAHQIKADIIVNIQGDEPLIDPRMIEEALVPFSSKSIVMGTVAQAMVDPSDLSNPNIVKVAVSRKGFALYFSRSPIPFPYDAVMAPSKGNEKEALGGFFKHIGLYVYRKDFLQTFAGLKPGVLEQTEHLEQLRALEYGYNIRVVETKYGSIGVDTLEDVKKVEALMKERKS